MSIVNSTSQARRKEGKKFEEDGKFIWNMIETAILKLAIQRIDLSVCAKSLLKNIDLLMREL